MKQVLKILHWTVTLQLRERLRERRAARRVADGGLFDPDYYRDHSPDLGPHVDPVVHYVRHGASELRDPNPFFDTRFYLAQNPDVAAAGRNPLDHFGTEGWLEGRSPHPEFDLAYYRDENPDVGSLNPLAHYLAIGRHENRPTAPGRPGIRVTRIERPTAPDRPCIRVTRIERPLDHDLDHAAPEADDPLVICVAHVVPYPPRAGNHQRLYRYLRWLEERGYQVLMISSPLPGEELDDAELERAAAGLRNFVYCVRDGEVRTSLEPHLEPLLAGLEATVVAPIECDAPTHISPMHGEMEAVFCPDVAVRTILHIDTRLERPAIVISHYAFSTRFLPHLQPGTLKILDTIDVFSTKHDKVAAYGVDGEIILSPEAEREFLLRADVILAIQPEEARELERLTADRPVITAGIDFDPAPETYARRPDDAPPTVLLIASANALNVKGLRDFLRYAWPLVRRDHPEARLLVGGAVSRTLPDATPGVVSLGFVHDPEALYRDCHLVINPAVAGTGLKIKTVEALAAHRPIITFPLGVDGLPPELASLCAVASDWYEFYLQVSGLLAARSGEAFSREERDRIASALSGATNYRMLGEVLAGSHRTALAQPALARPSDDALDSAVAP